MLQRCNKLYIYNPLCTRFSNGIATVVTSPELVDLDQELNLKYLELSAEVLNQKLHVQSHWLLAHGFISLCFI
jgi:hypothetical protein